MIMPYGLHKGKHFEDIPITYLKWLETSNTEKSIQGPSYKHSEFKVPRSIELEARRVLESMGYTKHGTRWIKEER
jgi:hypothetical protein